MTAEVVSIRALNRATLDRQLLLRRSGIAPFEAVAYFVGMQAQVPLNPYLGLWSRLDEFEPDDVATLLLDRKLVRIVVMRATIHLVTADDCLLLRPLMQPVLHQELTRHRDFAPTLRGVDMAPVLEFVKSLVAERPHTVPQLRAALREKFPDLDAAALVYACRNLLALVQVPPRGIWGRAAQVTYTTAEAWLARPLAHAPSIDEVVVRYLRAFGPATVADAATWSRLTALSEVLERLRPKLRSFRDERGRELFDVPDAPLPDPDTPAPPRFLPEYDNVLLSHADRSRVFPDETRARLFGAERRAHGTVLHDGFACATWSVEHDRDAGSVTLFVDAVTKLTKTATAAVAAEGRRMLAFLEPDAEARDVRVSVQ